MPVLALADLHSVSYSCYLPDPCAQPGIVIAGSMGFQKSHLDASVSWCLLFHVLVPKWGVGCDREGVV